MKGGIAAAASRTGAWLRRWQELIGWGPLAVAVTIGAWILLTSIDGVQIGKDTVPRFLELPVGVLRLLLASGVAYLVWRRWRIKLTPEQQAAYWQALMAGAPGALAVHLTNAAFYLCVFLAALFSLLRW